jgi:hypothetical protein
MRGLGEVLNNKPSLGTSVKRLRGGALPRGFIAHSSPRVPLLGMSATRRDEASLLEACSLKERRVKIVVMLLAQISVVVLLMAFGWWGITTFGSDSLRARREPLYVAGCPLADTLEKHSAGWGCSKEGASHPISTRQPGGGLVGHAHGAERHGEGKVAPRTSED